MRSRFLAVAAGLLLLVAAAFAAESQSSGDPDARPVVPGKAEGAMPFTGSIRIRQEGGSLYYDFKVEQGKVTGGTCAHRNRRGVLYDIVGGWYDRERLVLLLQGRGKNIRDQWFAHAHQFRRTGETFELEHTLFGYGKTMDSGIVFQPHVIDRLEERQ